MYAKVMRVKTNLYYILVKQSKEFRYIMAMGTTSQHNRLNKSATICFGSDDKKWSMNFEIRKHTNVFTNTYWDICMDVCKYGNAIATMKTKA